MTHITSYNRRRPWQPLVLLALAALGVSVAFGVARTGEAASQTVPNNTAPPVDQRRAQGGLDADHHERHMDRDSDSDLHVRVAAL